MNTAKDPADHHPVVSRRPVFAANSPPSFRRSRYLPPQPSHTPHNHHQNPQTRRTPT